MNTKKKHKNRPKPTPNPSTNVETEVQETDDIVPKSDLCDELSVTPVDEVQVTTSIVESEMEIEAPKKPKRKGKKKNQVKENTDTKENIQETIKKESTPFGEQFIEDNEDKNQEVEGQVPSARKKKNKKKIQEQSSNQQVMTIKESAPIPTPLETEVKELKLEMGDLDVKEDIISRAEEPRPEAKSKKKNKKKKRNDSEKSDKSEEVTCTSAFKQLLTETEQETDITENTKSKDENNVSSLESDSKLCQSADTKTAEECNKFAQDDTETAKNIPKKKNKNKKDKKISQELQEKVTQVSEKTDINVEPKQFLETEPLKSETVQQSNPEPYKKPDKVLLDFLDIIDLSQKPKAKIVKPVEKKRKGLEDMPLREDESRIDEGGSLSKITTQDNLRAPIEHTEIVTLVEEKSEEILPMSKISNTIDTIDELKVPDTKSKEKKRKKSPKPHKTEKEEYEVLKEPSQTPKPDGKAMILHEKIQIITDTQEKNISEREKIKLTISDSPVKPLQNFEKIDDVPPLLNIDKTDELTETRSAKRKKKTLKFPVHQETSDKAIKQLITPEATETKEEYKIGDQLKAERVSESSSVPLSETEIRSVKTDDSASSCDATPDIDFMRSSSQLVRDPNKCMTIREIKNIDEMKPNEQVIPLVEDSSEIPACEPSLLPSGIQLTEAKITEKEEPTYLKSKMMEVNKDMEELRLSLERSLAEFSALEKSEQKAEKDCNPDKLECEKTFSEVKITQPNEQTISNMQTSPETQDTKDTPLSVSESGPVKRAHTKSKSKKKGKQETTTSVSSVPTNTTSTETSTDVKHKGCEKTEQKTESTEDKSKQKSESTGKKDTKQSDATELDHVNGDPKSEATQIIPVLEQTFSDSLEQLDFAPIDNFEDALTTSVDDVNKTFELIANEVSEESQKNLAANKPEINITAPKEDTDKKNDKKDEKVHPISQPKNFLGHTDIPAQSNRTDYKKEKNKAPNERQAKVKIKDSTNIGKKSKESQTDTKTIKKNEKSEKESYSRVLNDNEEYVYKYSFRKVFLQSACHICHKDLVQRVPCGYCNLVFYCSAKHKDEDWPQHQALCFAVSTIAHLKDQKHVYADAQRVTGQEYRLLRMQMIVSCEKVLKRRLVPWEQEAMLYPRMCGDVSCRDWRQGKLTDCEGCGQISYCADRPDHLPKFHQRWCKSYHLYAKLVGYQQTRGRLEPVLPTKVMASYRLADKMNEVLAVMYEEKIDMNDIQYAALTQLATAPLTAAYCFQLSRNKLNNGVFKKTSFTIHVVGAELQFEADALNKWEVFFLHLRPDLEELRVVLISPALNPGDLPLDLLGKIKLCDHCRENKRRVLFNFQDKKNYFEYRSSEEFVSPDLVCAFNPSIQRSSMYNGKDPWPLAINSIIKQKVPFIITGYTLAELRKDVARVKDCSETDFRVITEPVCNSFASVRPDRNFISDDEMPLLFKNYCVAVLCGC